MRKAQTRMDIFKVVLGLIGFIIIILLTTRILAPAKTSPTGNAVIVDGACTQINYCNDGLTCVNSKCETQTSAQTLDSLTASINLPKKVYGQEDSVILNLNVINTAPNVRHVKLGTPIITNSLGNNAREWIFTQDTSFTQILSGDAITLSTSIKTPKNFYGTYQITIPIIIQEGGISSATTQVIVAQALKQEVYLTQGQKLTQLKYYSIIRPCPKSYYLIEQDPSRTTQGTVKLYIPFCNYGEHEEEETVLGVTTNYNYYQSNQTSCLESVKRYPGTDEKTVFECELPLYTECAGQFHLQMKTDYPEANDSIENNGWMFSIPGYCMLEPENAFVKNLDFNHNTNNPQITATITNRYGSRQVDASFSVTNNQEEGIIVCTDEHYYEQHEEKSLTCNVQKNGYPYSFWGTGKKIKLTLESNEYQDDNIETLNDQPVFEYINVGIVSNSLKSWRDTDETAKFSFDVQNTGDYEKTADYKLIGKRIEHVTDSTPEQIAICSGTIDVPSGQTITVNCDLKTQELTIISCDTEDGCVNDGSFTLKAEITVEHQTASVFNAQMQRTSTNNSYVIPIYEEASIKSAITPELTT